MSFVRPAMGPRYDEIVNLPIKRTLNVTLQPSSSTAQTQSLTFQINDQLPLDRLVRVTSTCLASNGQTNSGLTVEVRIVQGMVAHKNLELQSTVGTTSTGNTNLPSQAVILGWLRPVGAGTANGTVAYSWLPNHEQWVRTYGSMITIELRKLNATDAGNWNAIATSVILQLELRTGGDVQFVD